MIQLQLPDEVSVYLNDIKEYREKNLEPNSNKQIVIDALKDMHSKIKEQHNVSKL